MTKLKPVEVWIFYDKRDCEKCLNEVITVNQYGLINKMNYQEFRKGFIDREEVLKKIENLRNKSLELNDKYSEKEIEIWLTARVDALDELESELKSKFEKGCKE